MAEKRDNLERILYLIPYVSKHQGIKISELAEAIDVTEKEILKDLHDLFMSGPNEWQHVDIYVDNKGRVFVENADFFTKPLSLTIPEAFSLMAAGDVFKKIRKIKGIEVLEGALQKIYSAIPEDIRDKARFIEKRIAIAPAKKEREEIIGTIEKAIKEKKELELEYYTYSKDEFVKRTVRPYGLINYAEQWYLVGFCMLRNKDRIFRVDRIKSAKKAENKFSFPKDFDINKFVSDRMYQYPLEGMIVKIKFDSNIARWFEEVIEEGNFVKNKDGSIIATFYTSTYSWIIKWLLPYAEHVQILEPKFLSDELRKSAREILEI